MDRGGLETGAHLILDGDISKGDDPALLSSPSQPGDSPEEMGRLSLAARIENVVRRLHEGYSRCIIEVDLKHENISFWTGK